ncbi:uncharacterized protein EHS24_000167 [Apiotrichum porosum]|uniref:Uncharacterized protein n=1 Tax=Apiotrichum porosum TaxID=105984 RepID=A0A427Y9I5_9TREE|nr:uncharacterized protein EHS24_000167 [Apiotrichum porosum]RSH87654.1 hypothetical protein EHS24_000167 [Apiotrichum porosum]
MGAVQRLTDVCADPSRANDHDLALAKQLLEAYGEDATQTMAEWPTAAQQPPRDRPVIAAILDRYKVRGGRALARYPQVLWIAHLAAEHFEGFDSLIAELEVEYDCTIPKCNDGLGFPSPSATPASLYRGVHDCGSGWKGKMPSEDDGLSVLTLPLVPVLGALWQALYLERTSLRPVRPQAQPRTHDTHHPRHPLPLGFQHPHPSHARPVRARPLHHAHRGLARQPLRPRHAARRLGTVPRDRPPLVLDRLERLQGNGHLVGATLPATYAMSSEAQAEYAMNSVTAFEQGRGPVPRINKSTLNEIWHRQTDYMPDQVDMFMLSAGRLIGDADIALPPVFDTWVASRPAKTALAINEHMASYQKALDEDQEHRRLEVEHFDLKERRQKRQREDEAHELRTRLRQQGHRTAEQQYADLKAAKVVHDRLEAEAAAARDAYMASQGERMLDQVELEHREQQRISSSTSPDVPVHQVIEDDSDSDDGTSDDDTSDSDFSPGVPGPPTPRRPLLWSSAEPITPLHEFAHVYPPLCQQIVWLMKHNHQATKAVLIAQVLANILELYQRHMNLAAEKSERITLLDDALVNKIKNEIGLQERVAELENQIKELKMQVK